MVMVGNIYSACNKHMIPNFHKINCSYMAVIIDDYVVADTYQGIEPLWPIAINSFYTKPIMRNKVIS